MSTHSDPPTGNDWRWVDSDVIAAVHDRQLSEHGGPAGVRNQDGIESALARPVNLALYGNPDAADLAAAYAFGLARNHGFVDGNKRTAWIAARLFLAYNGYRLAFDNGDVVRLMEGVASGTVTEQELAGWFRERLG